MKSLIDLEPNECRFPIGEPKEPGFGFCGKQQKPGSPYCAKHHKRCYYKPKKKKAQVFQFRKHAA